MNLGSLPPIKHHHQAQQHSKSKVSAVNSDSSSQQVDRKQPENLRQQPMNPHKSTVFFSPTQMVDPNTTTTLIELTNPPSTTTKTDENNTTETKEQTTGDGDYLVYDDGMLRVPYPKEWQASRQNSILYFFSHLQLSTRNETKDNINVQVVISGEQTIFDLAREVIDSLSQLESYELLFLEPNVDNNKNDSSQTASTTSVTTSASNAMETNSKSSVSSLSSTLKTPIGSLPMVQFKARYKMHNSHFTQITNVIECGCGLKYLFTYTSNTSDCKTESVFQYMFSKAEFRTIDKIEPWNRVDTQYIVIQFPQMWTKQVSSMSQGTMLFFSPIQVVSQNRFTDNIVIQLLNRDGSTMEHDIEQLLDQLKPMKNFRIEQKVCKEMVSGNPAVMFHVKYQYNGKSLEQLTYLIKHPAGTKNKQEDGDNKKWMVSYTSMEGCPSRSLFEKVLQKLEFK